MGLFWDESVRISNETEIPLVYVIGMAGPMYWGVLQPEERMTKETGRVWFTVTCYPYDGHNEPTTQQVVLGNLIPAAAAIFVIATGGMAAAGAIPAAGTAAAALAPLVEAPALAGLVASIVATPAAWSVATGTQRVFLDSLERAMNKVEKTGHYANGDWLNVRGGIKKGQDFSAWQPMRFE
jgi:hypothetical protein